MNEMQRTTGEITRATILGAAGHIGRLLAGQLVSSGVAVTGIDLCPPQAGDSAGVTMLQGDAAAPGDEARRAIAAADAVLICLPEEAALAALPGLLKLAAADAVLIDTLSVKQPMAAARLAASTTQEHLSINPMFSPKLGFEGQNVAVVTIVAGPRGPAFVRLLESWGAQAAQVTAAEHDRMTALMQAATHAALLSLGMVLCDWDYDVQTGLRMATPPHRIWLAQLARICDAAPDVYWDIQRSNAAGPAARHAVANSLSRLDALVQAGRREEFDQMLARIGAVLAPRKNELLACADRLGTASRI
jgi:prephenate dehydrogenase